MHSLRFLFTFFHTEKSLYQTKFVAHYEYEARMRERYRLE